MAPKKKNPPVIEEMEEAIEQTSFDDEYVTFKTSHFYAVLVVLAFGLGLLAGYAVWGKSTPTIVQQVAPVPTAVPTRVPVVYDIETEGFPSRGPEDAPITIVEFSDYQCPFCYRWRMQVHDQLMAEYPGKIRFVFRNFPLSFHQNAFGAAEAALCAGDQGKYWEYHDILFDNYNMLNDQTGKVLGVADYSSFASGLGIDTAAFETCMTERKYKDFIEADMQYAAMLPPDNGEAAVGGTPTFFVNGHRLGGAYPIEYFREIIDAELAKLE